MVFQGGFTVFHGFGWFPWFFKVVSWFSMVFGWFYIYYDECLSVCLSVTKNDHFHVRKSMKVDERKSMKVDKSR